MNIVSRHFTARSAYRDARKFNQIARRYPSLHLRYMPVRTTGLRKWLVIVKR